MKKSRWILVVVITAAILLVIIYGFRSQPIDVDTARAAKGPMQVYVEEEGITRVKDRFIISAPVSGYMRRIILKEGDMITKGRTVARIEPSRSAALDPRSYAEAEAAVAAAEAAVRVSEETMRAAAADADYAARSLERIRQLFNEGFASRDNLEKAESSASLTAAKRLAAESQVKVSRFELERAKTALRFFTDSAGIEEGIVPVHTPVSGRVLRIHRESEGAVNSGDPLLDVADPEHIEVKAEVLSVEAVKMKPGISVRFVRWGGGPALSGKVRIIEPSGFTKISSLGVEEQRVLVISDITSSPADRENLKDGYRVEAHFIVWEGVDILQIPASALFRKTDGWAVFVVENGRARKRMVNVGQRTGLTAEIISGISEGELVITHPGDQISDGTRVRQR
jgi:HlyD family secretion protein